MVKEEYDLKIFYNDNYTRESYRIKSWTIYDDSEILRFETVDGSMYFIRLENVLKWVIS